MTKPKGLNPKDWIYLAVVTGSVLAGAKMIDYRLNKIELRLDTMESKYVTKDIFESRLSQLKLEIQANTMRSTQRWQR